MSVITWILCQHVVTSFLLFQALGLVHHNGKQGERIAASSQESPPIIQSSLAIKMTGGKVCNVMFVFSVPVISGRPSMVQ